MESILKRYTQAGYLWTYNVFWSGGEKLRRGYSGEFHTLRDIYGSLNRAGSLDRPFSQSGLYMDSIPTSSIRWCILDTCRKYPMWLINWPWRVPVSVVVVCECECGVCVWGASFPERQGNLSLKVQVHQLWNRWLPTNAFWRGYGDRSPRQNATFKMNGWMYLSFLLF